MTIPDMASVPVVDQQPQPLQAPKVIHGELYDAHLDSMLRRGQRFIIRHPSMLLTLAYLLCSVLGMLFVIKLFARFDFEILSYLELTDFMLVALTHPWVLMNVISWLLFFIVLFWLDRYARRQINWYAKYSEKYYENDKFKRYLPIFALTPLLFLYDSAISESTALAKSIQAGQQRDFQLSLINPVQDVAKTMQLDRVQIIARTSSYLFVYHQAQVKVIPHANIAVLLPQPSAVTKVNSQSVTKRSISATNLPISDASPAKAPAAATSSAINTTQKVPQQAATGNKPSSEQKL